MPSGGKRPGAGRPRGSPDKAEIAKLIEAGGITPLDYFLSILRDEDAPDEVRMWAAVHAAPYCHPRLNAINHTGNMTVKTMTQEEAVEAMERLDRGETLQ